MKMTEYDRKSDALIQLLVDKIEALDNKLEKHMANETNDIKELKEAFDTAKHVVSFVKWTSTIVASLAVAWVFFKEHFTFGIK